ncbi:phosphoribosyltransferase [uncultured Imperialibacter sp.]|uniref:phosphoribosyltransferase n=1 Tax=uncultured Imperialibacter sp. TaxID=1672639 RepID=UPI0030DA299A|tara:strand:- start:47443 stop:52236 length:4794 start_codon:yes stop_codon:yes gene_type:complete
MKFGDKVAEIHLDDIIHTFYQDFKRLEAKKSNRPYIFDFTNVGYVANEELLTLTALFRYLVEVEFQFKVKFLEKGFINLTERRAKAILGIWEEWKIHRVTTDDKLALYFDISDSTIQRIKENFPVSSKEEVEIYERHGVTPFISLPNIIGYDDKRIQKVLHDNVYDLNEATKEILRANNCYLPFETQTLSTIITKELYENFLDHFSKSIFETDNHQAFLSISLKKRINPKYNSESTIRKRLENNFNSESLPDTKAFFQNKEKLFKNQSTLEISFLDFGEGITESLKSDYVKRRVSAGPVHDNEILRYAFEYDSSRHPIAHRYLSNSDDFSFTRGLFDVLSIVNRFNGLLVARSGYGRLIYDFSETQNFQDAYRTFGNESHYFPGTLISIYFPESKKQNLFDYSSIKPISIPKELTFNYEKSRVINLYSINKRLREKNKEKSTLYTNLLELIINQVTASNEGLIFFDFEDFDIDERISRKIISFLVSDYRINNLNNVIVINPPPIEYLVQLNDELSKLFITKKQFVVHPTPFIYYDQNEDDITIFWLGVFHEGDILKLNELLFEIHDLRQSDFKDSQNVIGNANYFDQYGNLHSIIRKESILKIVKKNRRKSYLSKINDIISNTVIEIPNSIFLCSGNYYQYQYVKLFDILSNDETCSEISLALYQEIIRELGDVGGYKFISLTSSSKKIINKLLSLGLISSENVLELNNNYDFSNEDGFQKHVVSNDQVILICDVISTGYLTQTIESELQNIGARLSSIVVVVDATDEEFENDKFNYQHLKDKLISLSERPIKKYRRSHIRDLLISRKVKVVRIHPVTNSPILTSISQSNITESVLIDENTFLNHIDPKNIKVGYFKFNGLIHPYFFDMDAMLKDHQLSNPLIDILFQRLSSQNFDAGKLNVLVYPRGSGIRNMDFDYLRDRVLKNHNVQILELERFPTTNGWRFPHPSESMNLAINGSNVLVLDDGTCTGESIIQMIDEIAFLKAKRLVILTIIGRTNDSKRELFSRLDRLKGGLIIDIFFGVHWNIPTYYIEESPISKERQILLALGELGNTPYEIRKLTQNILKELELRSIDSVGSNYLVKNKDNSSVTKDLVLAKQLVGKISDYRFYKEYFDQFDEFIIQYESDKIRENRYKQIEDICIVFLHEPYFFTNVKRVVPDIIEKIEEFILTILFGNPRKVTAPKLPVGELYYAWTNKDLIHLFFTVFKGKVLFEILNPKNFKDLIEIWGKSTSDLNYIFYRLLLFMPIKKDQISGKKYSGIVRLLIQNLLEDQSVKKGINHIKQFSYFIASLPFSAQDFYSHVCLIKSNYGKVYDDEMHNEYIRNNKQLLSTQLIIVEKKMGLGESYQEELSKIRNAWSLISKFISELLQFSSTYLDFFIYPGNAPLEFEGISEFTLEDLMQDKVSYDNLSLRQLAGVIEGMVHDSIPFSPRHLRKIVNHVFDKYIEKKSDYPIAFKNINTSNFIEIFQASLNRFEVKFKINFMEMEKISSIEFPKFYFKKAMTEVSSNLRYAQHGKPIHVDCNLEQDSIVFSIINTKKSPTYANKHEGDNNELTGSGKGVELLKRLNNYPIPTSYSVKETDINFFQEFRFKCQLK